MSIKRKLVRIETPKPQPGFLGPDHTKRAVVSGGFSASDPFILLMDDDLDKKDNTPVGGAHPHAGFETVSLLLEGEVGDAAHTMKSGDFQIMTAGSGIVHTETIDKAATMRLLQLWINLSKKDRLATPRVQDLPLEHAPTLNERGVHIKVYSGSLAGLTSPIENYTPMVIADVTIEMDVTTTLDIPANFNTFLYVLDGSVVIGEDEKGLNKYQVGWLDMGTDNAASELKLTAGKEGVCFSLYAGKPTGDTIVSHGPFIADSQEDIMRFYSEYRQGKMKHISRVPESQRLSW
ncbi:pirin family protein [Segetibacter koreensis]|uniref:pirin family protein n=1 Tax=Segetibacter koreensis TaxID=398037 RepID=UPI0004768479|nr:pirin-like C-terminal cupin domain-containing protein [Segetibacter koreensis]